MKTFVVDESAERKRADVFLAEKYPQFARAALAKLFPADKVHINGKPEKAGYKVRLGDKMTVDDSWLVEREFDPIELSILFENDSVIVVDKPSGVLSHARGGLSTEASVASFLRGRVDPTTEGAERREIVHRLDRATSGVMVCAKTSYAQSFLQKQFHDRSIQKTYLAVLSHVPKEPAAIIDAPIGRNLNNPKTFRVDAHGKSAVTEYTVIKQKSDGTCLVRMHPITGRTHQLRVHAAYISCPIVGDTFYDGKKADRLMLHAHTISVVLPGDTSRQHLLVHSRKDLSV